MKGKQWILALIASKVVIKPRESCFFVEEFCHTLPGLAAHLASASCIWKALNSSACLGFSKGRTESQEFSGIPRPSCPSPVGPAIQTARTSVQPRGSIIVSEVYRSLYSPSTKCSCPQLWAKT